jgi:hypothetical protein
MLNPTGSSGSAGGDGCTAPLEDRILSARPVGLNAILLSASGAERFIP